MTNERMRRVFQRPAVWDEGVGLVQKMGGDGVGGCRWLAVVSREKRSRERWCGALLSASLDLPKLGSGQRGRKPSVPPTLFCRCLSWPTRILAETVRILVGTVCRNFDVASNGGSQPSNGIHSTFGWCVSTIAKNAHDIYCFQG